MAAAEEKRTKAERSSSCGQLVQVPGGVDLGSEDALELLGVERLDHAVVEHAGGVDHRAQGVLGGDRGEQLLQLPRDRRRRRRRSSTSAPSSSSSACSSSAPSALRAAAADQEQVAGAVLFRQVAGDEGAEAAGGAGDEDGSVGVERLGDGEHDLADVAALAEVAEGLGGAAHVPGADRRVTQRAALEELDDLGEHLPDALGAGLGEVEGAVGDAGVLGCDLLGVADVGLAHLQEAAAAGQAAPARRRRTRPPAS